MRSLFFLMFSLILPAFAWAHLEGEIVLLCDTYGANNPEDGGLEQVVRIDLEAKKAKQIWSVKGWAGWEVCELSDNRIVMMHEGSACDVTESVGKQTLTISRDGRYRLTVGGGDFSLGTCVRAGKIW